MFHREVDRGWVHVYFTANYLTVRSGGGGGGGGVGGAPSATER